MIFKAALYPALLYLKDLLRGRIDGDLLPSSSIRLGFDSFDEKWRSDLRSSSPGPAIATGVPTWELLPAAAAAAANPDANW